MLKLLNKRNPPLFRRYLRDEAQIYKFEVNGKNFVYDTNSMALFEGDDDDVLPQDHRNGYGAKWEPQLRPPVIQPGCTALVLEPTIRCNLRCKYCFVGEYDEDISKTDLSMQDIKMGVNTLFAGVRNPMDMVEFMVNTCTPAINNGNMNLGFFGGEPLMRFDLMQQAVSYMEGLADARKKRCTYSVTTNATLVTEKIAKFLSEHNFSSIVSLDGPQEIHDALRVDAQGKGTFERTMRGLELYKKYGVSKRTTLRATYPAKNRVGTVLDRVKFLNELVEQGYASSVSVEPVMLSEGCVMPDADEMRFEPKDAEQLESDMLEAAEWYANQLNAGKAPKFHHIYKPVERLFHRIHAFTECGAGNGYFGLGPGGVVYACHRFRHTKIGELKKGGVDEKLRRKWLDNRLYKSEKCTTCPVRFLCGGGCRENSMNDYGNTYTPVPFQCAFARILFKCATYVISEVPAEIIEAKIPMPRVQQRRQLRPGPNQMQQMQQGFGAGGPTPRPAAYPAQGRTPIPMHGQPTQQRPSQANPACDCTGEGDCQ